MHLSGRDHLSCKLCYLEDVEDSERQPAEGEDSAHQDEQDADSVTNRSLKVVTSEKIGGSGAKL